MKLDSTYAEQVVLASVIINPFDEEAIGQFARISATVSSEMFHNGYNKQLFDMMVSLTNHRIPPTSIHIAEKVKDNNSLNQYFWNVIVPHATSNDTETHLEIVRKLHTARNIYKVCQSTSSMLCGSNDVLETIKEVESNLSKAMASGIPQNVDEGYLGDYISEYYDTIQNQMNSTGVVGVPTGLPKLDNVLGGLKAGELITVAGRTGMGKSSLIATWIVHQLMQGYKPAVFSQELQRKEIVDKLKSILSEVDGDGDTIPFMTLNNPAGHFGGVKLGQRQLERMQQLTMKYLVDSKMYIRGASKLSVEEGISICRKLIQEGNCDVAYFDHIGLMVQDKNNAVAELSNITGSLKLFAGESNIPIVEVVQLSRSADTATEKPKLSHCKGSGSIEEDSNIVIMPWRPYAINREGDPSESEIILAKSRNTETGDFTAEFSTITTQFKENIQTNDRY